MKRVRNKVQREAREAIYNSKSNSYIDIAPRVGKSKIICDFIKKLSKKASILITVPYDSIMESWKKEFEKWDVDDKNITLINQRSLGKEGDIYNYIIIDEVHGLSLEQTKVLKKFSSILVGVSGSIGNTTAKSLVEDFKMKCVYKFTIEQAVDAGIISPFEINCIGIPLDRKEQYIPGGSKAKPFMTTEYSAYNYYTKMFNKFRVMSYNDMKYHNAKMGFANKRANLIYNAKSKVALAKKIVEQLNQRTLLFTARTAIADEFAKDLGGVSYHSNVEEDTLSLFSNDHSQFLAVCEMVNMGITFPNLKVGIFHQLRSSEEATIQKAMRMCNLEGKKKAKIYITYFQDTVEDNWLKSALGMFEEKRINHIPYKKFMNEQT